MCHSMGCTHVKLAPSPYPETIPSTSQPGNIYKPTRGGKSHAPTGGQPTRKHLELDAAAAKDKQTIAVKKKRVARYRDKFDARVIAKYEIKALIGRGSFSRVVRAEHKKSRQPYAIKMIELNGGRELFDSEVSVLRRIRHPNVIQLVEVFETKDRVYMVMELATGGELFDRIIERGNFTERDATRCLQMVLDGIQYLHSLGITHRDLKPENLLFYHPGADSKILITDFGLSCCRKSGENSLMQTTCGTPEYIAPEILLRKPYTSAVDMWALGVITYILLSGTMPFDEDNKTRLYRSIVKANYSFSAAIWKDVSEEARQFISGHLVLNPEIRITSAEALKHPWITSNAAASCSKNLSKNISHNLLERASTRSSKGQSGANKQGHQPGSTKGVPHPLGVYQHNPRVGSYSAGSGKIRGRMDKKDPEPMVSIESTSQNIEEHFTNGTDT